MVSDLPARCSATQPWSSSSLKRLSNSLRDGTPAPPGCPSYEDVLIWYDDLAAAVSRHLHTIDWLRVADSLGGIQTTFRAKTIDTLREKLRRTPNISLGYVQDVAGVRLEADMNTLTQDAVTERVVTAFDHDSDAIKDYRNDAHSGYRAVHVWLRLPAGRVEVQIRTSLQSQWANAFEALADLVGRGIRYGELPIDPTERTVTQGMIDLSTNQLAGLEALSRTLAISEDSLAELREEMAARIVPRDEGLTRVDEIEGQLALLRSQHSEQIRTYHDLLVDLHRTFRSLRREP